MENSTVFPRCKENSGRKNNQKNYLKCEVAQSFVLCFDLYRFVVMFRLQRLPKADRYLTWEV